MKKICVIGSINMDLVASMKNFPAPGEAVICNSFNEYTGGKGANQAIGLGRLGSDVAFVGKVGNDDYGECLLGNLIKNNVNVECTFKSNDIHSGISMIFINSDGQNCIAHHPGANGSLSFEDVEKAANMIYSTDIILLQLEIPLDLNFFIIKENNKKGKTIILDPAPFSTIPDEIFPLVSVITPNRIEIERMTGIKVNNKDDSLKACKILLKKGVKNVINKIDEYGVFLMNKDFNTFIKPLDVKAIDTVGAGDAFNAGLAYSLSRGKDLISSAKVANLIGAISVTKKGAQDSLPSREETYRFLLENDLEGYVDLFEG
jgi:ribokinase